MKYINAAYNAATVILAGAMLAAIIKIAVIVWTGEGCVRLEGHENVLYESSGCAA